MTILLYCQKMNSQIIIYIKCVDIKPWKQHTTSKNKNATKQFTIKNTADGQKNLQWDFDISAKIMFQNINYYFNFITMECFLFTGESINTKIVEDKCPCTYPEIENGCTKWMKA